MRLTMTAAAVLLAGPAFAGDPDTDYGPPRRVVGYSKMCNVFTGHCEWEPRYARSGSPIYTHPHRPPIGYYPAPYRQPTYVQPSARADMLSEGPRCVDVRVSAIGIEAFDKAKAKEQAEAALAEIVRARWGSRYMDVAHAQAVVFECWRSATGNRQSEKIADLGGKELHQCQIQSTPCRAQREVAASDDPATQAAIERLERQGYEVKVQEPIPERRRSRLMRRFFKKDPQ